MSIKLYKFKDENKYFYGTWEHLKDQNFDNTSGWKLVKPYKKKYGELIKEFLSDQYFIINSSGVKLFIESWPSELDAIVDSILGPPLPSWDIKPTSSIHTPPSTPPGYTKYSQKFDEIYESINPKLSIKNN